MATANESVGGGGAAAGSATEAAAGAAAGSATEAAAGAAAHITDDAGLYDAWYASDRGRWIGETETELLRRMLDMRPEESVLDVGCGTGYFTRQLASAHSGPVVGVDLDAERIVFARWHACCGETYGEGSALDLPFATNSMDVVVSITALCFTDNERMAAAEMVRVARRRVAVGLLGRRSLLYLQKGRAGGTGAYGGARWHTARAAREVLGGLGPRVANVTLRSAIFLPSGSAVARAAECVLPSRLPLGAFLLVTADVLPD